MQVSREREIADRRYGPPNVYRARSYNPMLELLEVQTSQKLYSEYSQDINNYLSILELNSSVNVSMIDLQPEIQWFMRPFLLDFLIELHASFKLQPHTLFKLQPHTLFLCINIIDRYCSKRIVFKRHYQLVGCTALWIAGKYEDKKSRVPTLKELSMMCRNAYDEDMFVQMEMHILSTLEWSLGHPNLEDCLQIAIASSGIASDSTPFKYGNSSKGSSLTSAVTAVGRYLNEISLYSREFMDAPTSLVSITANLLACTMLQIPNASLYLKSLIAKKQEKKEVFLFDEDAENQRPDVQGPFLTSFDEFALNQIRRLSMFFVLQLSKVTEVLSKKHDELGVIQVVQNFNNRFSHAIKIIHQNQSLIEESAVESFGSGNLLMLADSLLQLNTKTKNLDGDAPLTPPSASSQFSVFSNNVAYTFETPMKDTQFTTGYKDSTDSPNQSLGLNDWSSPIPSKMHT